MHVHRLKIVYSLPQLADLLCKLIGSYFQISLDSFLLLKVEDVLLLLGQRAYKVLRFTLFSHALALAHQGLALCKEFNYLFLPTLGWFLVNILDDCRVWQRRPLVGLN